ncbi:MAG TPA: cytochrome c peroxidase [Polyangiaceae bacterium]|nr:cytochrome c peroxidase [Polyangiaceae bacterium]
MFRFSMDPVALRLLGALALGLPSCTSADAVPAGDARADDAPATRVQSLSADRGHPGRRLFERALPGSNGRSCATCHVLDEDTTLHPESVAARLARAPGDPLFDRLDADDPSAQTLRFEHLKKGLIRVVLPLPDNMDLIDFAGNVSTPPERTIEVWRGVPSVADTAFTAPYQLDGRQATLEDQAQAAITNHSQGPQQLRRELEQLADFERQAFASPRSWFVSRLIDYGLPLGEIPVPEKFAPLNAKEQRGLDVYERACQACHGSATSQRIIDREVHDLGFPELKADGNVRFEMVGGKPVPVLRPRPDDEFLNVGFGFGSYAGQLGKAKVFNSDVELPRYRFRFYSDATRRQAVVDLPPAPATQSGDPFDFRPQLDAEGAPIVGPNLAPQLFSTDPGRAAISGDPADFEAFDVPPLRGIARTAPYYHDNSIESLEEVIDNYSRFVLRALPPLQLQLHPPETPDTPPEALSREEKAELLAFLRRL